MRGGTVTPNCASAAFRMSRSITGINVSSTKGREGLHQAALLIGWQALLDCLGTRQLT